MVTSCPGDKRQYQYLLCIKSSLSCIPARWFLSATQLVGVSLAFWSSKQLAISLTIYFFHVHLPLEMPHIQPDRRCLANELTSIFCRTKFEHVLYAEKTVDPIYNLTLLDNYVART